MVVPYPIAFLTVEFWMSGLQNGLRNEILRFGAH